ncbi:MAG: hypothetical protein HGB31_02785 [Erysipelotrichaceae bacterium]|nr:hypothetical protein [Erysipelotrichaceae bacterium]
MDLLLEIWPFLLPIILIELILLVMALVHILTHSTYKRGTRTMWVIISFIQIIGPILYFTLGRSDE